MGNKEKSIQFWWEKYEATKPFEDLDVDGG
jgi:hypothetical protein